MQAGCTVHDRWMCCTLSPVFENSSSRVCPFSKVSLELLAQVFDWKRRAALAADPSLGQLSEGKVTTLSAACCNKSRSKTADLRCSCTLFRVKTAGVAVLQQSLLAETKTRRAAI